MNGQLTANFRTDIKICVTYGAVCTSIWRDIEIFALNSEVYVVSIMNYFNYLLWFAYKFKWVYKNDKWYRDFYHKFQHIIFVTLSMLCLLHFFSKKKIQNVVQEFWLELLRILYAMKKKRSEELLKDVRYWLSNVSVLRHESLFVGGYISI